MLLLLWVLFEAEKSTPWVEILETVLLEASMYIRLPFPPDPWLQVPRPLGNCCTVLEHPPFLCLATHRTWVPKPLKPAVPGASVLPELNSKLCLGQLLLRSRTHTSLQNPFLSP